MKTIVYLCRHGAYENPDQVMHLRSPGFPLSAEGHAQAERLAGKLAGKKLIAIYASPLTRAHQTAQHVAKPHGLPIVTDERLLDLRSPLQGKSLAYMETINFNFFRRDFIKAGGERLREAFDRMDDFIREKVQVHRGSEFAVVSHGDGIMSIETKYRGGKLYTRKVFVDRYVGTACGYRIVFDGLRPVEVTIIP